MRTLTAKIIYIKGMGGSSNLRNSHIADAFFAIIGRVSMWSSTCGHAMVEYDVPQCELKSDGGKSYSTMGNEIPRLGNGRISSLPIQPRQPCTKVSTREGSRRPPMICGGNPRPPLLWMGVEAGLARKSSHHLPPWNLFSTTENQIPPWSFQSHRAISHSAMA